MKLARVTSTWVGICIPGRPLSGVNRYALAPYCGTHLTEEVPVAAAAASAGASQDPVAANRQVANDLDEVLSISSNLCVNDGAKRTLPPGDSAYRGSTTAARVKVGDGVKGSVTRSRSSSKAVAKKKKKARAKVKARTIVESSDDEIVVSTGPTGMKRPLSHKVSATERPTKKANVILDLSSSDDAVVKEVLELRHVHKTDPTPPVDVPSRQNHIAPSAVPLLQHSAIPKNASQPTTRSKGGSRDRHGGDSDKRALAALLGTLVREGSAGKEAIKKLAGFIRSTDRWREGFLDIEAEEDVEVGEPSDDDMLYYHGKDLDQYDHDDPFLNDGDADDGHKSDEAMPANDVSPAPSAVDKGKGKAKQEPCPGYNHPDPVDNEARIAFLQAELQAAMRASREEYLAHTDSLPTPALGAAGSTPMASSSASGPSVVSPTPFSLQSPMERPYIGL
ncbi:hypothetical protein BKA70DRAFT_1242510 [Coprinopsis sp. MPI-PUGE-AT-0042]|nr:hypothetical protein BKA70DRAFT_1242510 [Coprinopsis sp. MPI-PUGE-AT-0042]